MRDQIYTDVVLVVVSTAAVIKHHGQKEPGQDGALLFRLLNHSLSVKRSRKRSLRHGGVLPTGLLLEPF